MKIGSATHRSQLVRLLGRDFVGPDVDIDLRQDYPEVPVDLLVAFIAWGQNRLIPSIAERKLIGDRTSDARSPDDDEAK